MKKIVYILLLITLPSLTSLAQKLETAGIVSIYTQGIGASDDLGESLYRIEVTKTEKFNVLDRLDMMEIIQQLEVDPKLVMAKSVCLRLERLPT